MSYFDEQFAKIRSKAVNPFKANQDTRGAAVTASYNPLVASASRAVPGANQVMDTVDPMLGTTPTTALNPSVSMAGPGIGENTSAEVSEALLDNPGAFEKAAPGLSAKFDNPFAGEQQIQGMMGQIGDHTGSGNLAAQQYASSVSGRPTLAEDAGVGAGYDLARQRAIRDIQSGAAATGLLGSTYTLGQIGQTSESLNAAQQAAEADYRMKVADYNRLYNTMLGEQARGAEESQRGWFGTGIGGAQTLDELTRGRYGAQGDIAKTQQQMYEDRLTKGSDQALASERARTQRVQDMLGQIAGRAGASSNVLNAVNQAMISGNTEFMSAIAQNDIAGALAALNISNQDQAQQQQATNLIANLISTFGSGGV